MEACRHCSSALPFLIPASGYNIFLCKRKTAHPFHLLKVSAKCIVDGDAVGTVQTQQWLPVNQFGGTN